MRSVFTALGVIVVLDYVADGEFDWTRHSISEPFDAAVSAWNWGERQFNRVVPSPD